MENGNVNNLVSIVSEITGETFDKDLTSSDAAVLIKDFYENIIAKLPGHVYWLNRKGVYLGCNDQQAESAGLVSREGIVGKKIRNCPGITKLKL